jgi:hypothetical protein
MDPVSATTSLLPTETPDSTAQAVAGAPATPAAAGLDLAGELLKRYNRAGAPNITDLGLDAHATDSNPLGTGSPEDADEDSALDLGSGQDQTGFPGERVPHISYGFEGERWRVRNAVWVMAQSQLGESLLRHIYQSGYRIGFDNMACPSEKLRAYANPHDRVIILDNRASPEQLVLQLAYQAAIGSAARDGLVWDTTTSPPSALALERMITAYAISIQLQICYELRTAESMPAQADREIYWRLVTKLHHRSAGTFAQAAINDMAVEQGAAAAAAIREFYLHTSARLKCDRGVIEHYNSLPQSTLKDPKSLTLTIDPTTAAFKLKMPCMAYALQHEPKLDLAAPENLAIVEEIDTALQSLQAIRKNAGVKDKDSWHIPYRPA